MINLVSEYNNYVKQLPELINNTYYKAEFFIKELGVSPATYYRKLKENNFTAQEVTILTRILFPKETYKKELLERIEQGREDFKTGNTKTSKEVREAMRKRLESYQ